MKQVIDFRGLYNSLDETKTPAGRAYAMQNASTDHAILEIANRYTLIGSRPGANSSDVCWGLGFGKFACNATQRLLITGGIPTSGTVVLSWNGHSATAVPYDSPASEVQAALQLLQDFQDGEIVCTGGPWPAAPIYASFHGRYANAAQSLIVLGTNTMNNSATVTIESWITGGAAEEYLVVVQPSGTGTSTLYKVTSSNGFASTTWTSVATGLSSSDWFFQQYADRVYAVNASDGLTYKQLGGNWAGSASISGVSNPTVAPTMSSVRTDSSNSYDWTSATFGNFVGWGSNPSISAISAGLELEVTLNAALSGQTVSFDVTLPAAANFSRQDYHLLEYFSTTAEITMDASTLQMQLINNDTVPLTLTPPFIGTGTRADASPNSRFQREFHWGSQDRSLRDNTIKVRFTLTVLVGTNTKKFTIQLFRLDTWPNDRMSTLDINAGATLDAPQYAYSYLKFSTGAESKLSPIGASARIPSATHNDGVHVQVTVTGSASLTTGDYIKIYRKDRFGMFRFIGMTANVTVGTTTFIDTNILSEIEDYPTFGIIPLPGGFLPTGITKWKGCLVVSGDRKAWLSYSGLPLVFAPDPDNFAATSNLDPDDPNIPRTVYMSADRTEEVLGMVGQDSLYLFGASTSSAMAGGDTPLELSVPHPLPGSRGTIGHRSFYSQSGGVLSAAISGLWYYAVSAGFTGIVASETVIEQEVSQDIRQSWKDVFGSGPSNAVVSVFNEEMFVFSGAQYIKFTRNKQFEQGTLTDSLKAALPTQANGFIFATSKGELMRFGEYTTDNGVEVTWSYSTGKVDAQRLRLLNLEVQYQGSPSILFEIWDSNAGYESQVFDLATGDDTSNFYPLDGLLQGDRVRLTISGGGSDKVEFLALNYEGAKGGKGN